MKYFLPESNSGSLISGAKVQYSQVAGWLSVVDSTYAVADVDGSTMDGLKGSYVSNNTLLLSPECEIAVQSDPPSSEKRSSYWCPYFYSLLNLQPVYFDSPMSPAYMIR